MNPRNSGSRLLAHGLVRHRLDNDLEVLVLPKRDVPVVTSMIWYLVGSVDERPGETGLAHFLEHMMFKGTDRYAVGDIDRMTQEAGGSNNAFTSYDYTAYYLDLPRESWTTALDIESNRMSSCSFDADEVENERTVVLSELDGGRDSPPRALLEEMGSLSYIAHPYHHPIIGWRSEVETVSRDRMFDFYRRHYCPANAIVVIAGDVSPGEAIAEVEARFGGLPAGQRAVREFTPEPPQSGERRVTLRPSENQVDRLAYAYHTCRAGEPDDYALDVLSTILTGGRSARLYRKLVEQDRIATAVHTSNEVRLFPGLFMVSATAREPGRLAELEASLDQELERMATEPVTEEEITRARAILESSHVFAQQTTNDLAYHVGMFAALGDPEIFLRYLDELHRVQAADVQRVASTYLSRERRTVGWSLATEDAAVSA